MPGLFHSLMICCIRVSPVRFLDLNPCQGLIGGNHPFIRPSSPSSTIDWKDQQLVGGWLWVMILDVDSTVGSVFRNLE